MAKMEQWIDIELKPRHRFFWTIFWPTLLAVSIPITIYALFEIYTALYIMVQVKELLAR